MDSYNALVSKGKTMEEAFLNATHHILKQIVPFSENSEFKTDTQIEAESLEELFLDWLIAVLEEAESENLLISKTDARIGHVGDKYVLHGHIHGAKSAKEVNNTGLINKIGKSMVEVYEEDNEFVIKFSEEIL
jgi:SHS2 domain-containing protein